MRMSALVLTVALSGGAALPATAQDATEENWHHWRGPMGTGVAPHGQPPIEWSRTDNVRWRFEDPGLGFSSPIVWQNQVFITTAIETSQPGSEAEPEQRGIFGTPQPTNPRAFVVIALDRNSGAI